MRSKKMMTVILVAWTTLLLASCWRTSELPLDQPDSSADSDSDSDSDTDSDTDSDADADTDADTDSDSDADSSCTDVCPDNSGFPCPCPDETCADDPGSICGTLDLTTEDIGICLSPCEDNDDCTTTLSCAAEPKCNLLSGEDTDPEPQKYCSYVCETSADCPVGMQCTELGASTVFICYPEQ